MFPYVDLLKYGGILLLVIVVVIFVHDYRSTKSDLIKANTKISEITQINQDNVKTLEKLKVSIQEQSQAISTINNKFSLIDTKTKVRQSKIKELSQSKTDIEYEQASNQLYKESIKCILGC
jgi:septal ring factor EnvC (AmiA/AmiB activator)